MSFEMPYPMEEYMVNDSGPMTLNELSLNEEDLTPHQIGMRPYDDDMDSEYGDNTEYAFVYDINQEENISSIVRDLYEDFDNVNENVLDRIILYTIDPLPQQLQQSVEEKATETFECPICYEEKTLDVRVVPSCQHSYCKDCIIQHLNTFRRQNREATCACCRDTYYCMEVLNPVVYEELSQCIRNV